jgi:Bacterial Ig-like domain
MGLARSVADVARSYHAGARRLHAGMGPDSGSVRIGTYALQATPLTESYAAFMPAREDQNANALRDALADGPDELLTAVGAFERLQASAESVTGRCERAHELSLAVAEGRLLEADVVMAEVDSLLRLAERLDCDGRFDEELRLLRALHGLLVLTRRWLDLIRALHRALSAADEAKDLAAAAWVRHELGSLHLCTDDPEAAADELGQAVRLQQRLGQATGTCATRHNLDSARRDLATLAATERWPRRLRRFAGVVGVLTLLAAGGTGIALAQGGDPASPTPPTSTTGPLDSDPTSPDTTTVPTTRTSETTTSTTRSSTTVDVTAPVVALVTPHVGSLIPTRTPEFSGTAGVAPGDAAEVLVEIADERGRLLAAAPLRAPVVDGAWTVTPTFALADGSYQATATQNDGEGNTGSSETTFTIDTVAPVLLLDCPPTFNSLTISCTLTSTEAGTASFNLTEIRFRLRDESEFEIPAANAQTVQLKPDTAQAFDLTLPQDDFVDQGASVRRGFDVVAVQSDAAGNADRSNLEKSLYTSID